MKIQTFNPAPLRRLRKPAQVVKTDPPLSPLAIVNVSGVSFHAGSGQVTVTLDVNAGYELVDPTGDPAQWTVVFNYLLYRGIAFDYEGGAALTIYVEQYIGSFNPNSISYSADPSDIGDTQGRMLGEVDDFPI